MSATTSASNLSNRVKDILRIQRAEDFEQVRSYQSASELIRRVSYSYDDHIWTDNSLVPEEVHDLQDVSKNKVFLELRLGDITGEDVDTIVNAANINLKHGGGVARAISDAGGRTIQGESDEIIRRVGPLRDGFVVATSAGTLKSRFVVHAVGPQYNKNAPLQPQKDVLYSAVFRALKLADDLGSEFVSLPAISSGIFRFDPEISSRVVLHACMDFLSGRRYRKYTIGKQLSGPGTTSSGTESLRAFEHGAPENIKLVRVTIIDRDTLNFYNSELGNLILEQGRQKEDEQSLTTTIPSTSYAKILLVSPSPSKPQKYVVQPKKEEIASPMSESQMIANKIENMTNAFVNNIRHITHQMMSLDNLM